MNAKSDPILHMPRWICHKQVNADRIEHVQPASLTEGDASYAATLHLASGGKVRVGQSFVARGWPIKGNYLVQYDDGYLSWSPAQAFEAGYTRIYHPTPVILGQPTLPGAPDRPGPVCETAADFATDAAIHDRPPGEGWTLWLDQGGAARPFDQSPTYAMLNDGRLELWRKEWGDKTSFAKKQDLHPATNVAGLWWKKAPAAEEANANPR